MVLIAIFDYSLGAALGYSQERILSDYNMAESGFMGLGLIFMLFAPSLAAWVRGYGGISANSNVDKDLS